MPHFGEPRNLDLPSPGTLGDKPRMERDAAVITLKRTGILMPQRKRQVHRLTAVNPSAQVFFIPQRKHQARRFLSCERGYTYRLGVNYSTFVPPHVYQIYQCTTTTTYGLPTETRRAWLKTND